MNNIETLVERLHRQHGRPALPPPTDPFGLILWEQVGYLASDDRRAEAFNVLATRVGLTPEAILDASEATLEEIARVGGSIAAGDRAERMRRTARVTIEEWAGDLSGVLTRPLTEARRTLRRFPMIGVPGVDKILMLTRTHPILALDSNGLRVLLRVGYGKEGKSYATTYRNVQEAVAPECPTDLDWLINAHALLRRHGQDACKLRAPRCADCSAAEVCSYPSNV